ncbi:ABC transporter ATP-binding protein [Halofilum ochraceum]|uniref:ABC transporter ATP-binding protein n=1 Tax=Halofilum ochraceum TaxID=1611323 RepID=UPI0008DA5854|nr:ABC transporter ATP-binding protein [Halofilum ochraceum]
MIRFESVTKRFDRGAPAVDDLDLEIRDGELTVLVGPSGCGKTTSLRMINRLEDPSSGRVLVNGTDVMSQDRIELRRGIGYVMQTSGLFPHRRIRANIGTVPRLLGWSRATIDRRVEELADLVGLAPDLLDRFPHALSGGQRQRVGVARALAADPPLMLMDEPFAAVDPVVRAHLQDELVRLQRRLGKTIVFVTHDIEEAIRIGDSIAVFQNGGRIAQYASPTELLAAPANDFVVDFLGRDRELRRLALIDVADVGVEEAPLVVPGDSAEAAREVARRHGREWVIVVDDQQRLRGWLAVDALTGATVADAATRPFRYTVTTGESLRAAVNAMVASTIGVAPRVDSQGRLEGVLTQASLNPVLA